MKRTFQRSSKMKRQRKFGFLVRQKYSTEVVRKRRQKGRWEIASILRN